MNDHEPSLPRCLQRLQQVKNRTGMGRSWIYASVANGTFPAPLKIGRASVWDSRAIDTWIDGRVCATATRS
jgi:prophage regulatory protein